MPMFCINRFPTWSGDREQGYLYPVHFAPPILSSVYKVERSVLRAELVAVIAGWSSWLRR